MTRYKIENPDGTETVTGDIDTLDLINEYAIAPCIMAGCPDAMGYRLINLETGHITDTAEVRADINEALRELDLDEGL